MSGINISNRYENHTNGGVQSSSYGSSFSENVSIIGNQIQIRTNELSQDVSSDIPFMNNKFMLKFSEKDLKE